MSRLVILLGALIRHQTVPNAWVLALYLHSLLVTLAGYLASFGVQLNERHISGGTCNKSGL